MLSIEHLDAAVAEFAHKLKSRGIDAHIVGITQLPGAIARAAVTRDKFPSALKTPGCDDCTNPRQKAALPVHIQTLRPD